MKRILAALLAAVMLMSSAVFVSTAAAENAEMLCRTENLDSSWKQVSAGDTVYMVGDYDDKLDTEIREKTPNSKEASTHASQDTMAGSDTLWMQNTNTWAFGYVMEIKGIPEGETVTATVSSSSWSHDHQGVQGGGWISEPNKHTYTFRYDGTYTLYNTSYGAQKAIMRPDRVFTLWVRNYSITFNKDVEVRFLAQVEAVSGGTDPHDSDFSSPAKVTYHGRDGKALETVNVDVLDGYTPTTTSHYPAGAVALDYDMPDYVEGGITYTLIGWNTEPNAFRPNIEYAYGTMDVYPVYQATGVPFVTFMSEDGSEMLDRAPIIPGVTTETQVVPVKDSDTENDYTFDYWVDAEGNKVDITTLTEDTTVYAHFSQALKKYTISFVSQDGETVLAERVVEHGKALADIPTAEKADDTYQSYTFSRWAFFDGTEPDFTSVVGDMTVRPEFDAEFINPFTDLEEGRYYTEAAADALVNGILKGIDSTTFSPNGEANRAMLVTVLYRLEGEPDVSALPKTPFTDIKEGSYYYNALKWAYNTGVVSGLSATEFGPTSPLTREQFATMIYRYADQIRYYEMDVDEGTTLDGFADADTIHDYAKDAILWMTQESRKYLQGVPVEEEVYMQPAVATTRAMMATIMYRFQAEQDKLAVEFVTPDDEYTPIPFWFWNDTLTEEELERQIREFDSKGVNGFVIHPRLGLDPAIEYMGEEWMHFVRFAVELAAELDMTVFLYDEAMYPSGSCHGQVVAANADHASIGLRMSETMDLASGEIMIGQTEKNGTTYYFIQGFTGGHIRGVYYGEDDGQAGAPASADLLNPDAVASFIALTHQKYYDELSEYFGNTIQAIFTDEPSIMGRYCDSRMISWTWDFVDEFMALGYEMEDLYYLFKTEGSYGAKVKEDYETLVYERLKEVYYGQIADWCEEHGIALTGHPASSMDIGLLSEFDIPCQDIVWQYIYPGDGTNVNGEHSTMGKCASDSARHLGKERNGNECFGVCGHKDDPYKFTREDFKFYVDWLFSRGCNLIIPHAFYYSIRDARKDERPPQVGIHGEFWEDYTELTAYVKRVSKMNTNSVNMTDIAVMCTEDYLPSVAVKPLYENQIEFNYLEENLLDMVTIERGAAKIARQSYRVIITDRTYDEATEAFLKEFQAAGGTVIRWQQYQSKTADYVQTLRSLSLVDIDIDAHKDLRMTHVRKYGADAVFLSNEGEDTVETVIHENVKAIWDPETGAMIENYSGDELAITLEKRESIYVILK